MPYATLDDLIERAGESEIRQIADRDRDGTIDADVIESALRDADNLVNGWVGAKYTVPLASTPDLVRTWSVSIARYVLHRNKAPGHVKDDYDFAITSLKEVACGLIALTVAAGDDAPQVATGTVMASHPPQVFTDARLKGWR